MTTLDSSLVTNGHLAEGLDGSSSVLLLGSPLTEPLTETGVSLLAGDEPDDTSVVWVTFRQTPAAVLETWDDHVETRPAEFVVVTVGEELAGRGEDTAVEVENVESPSDLTGLGVTLTETIGTSTDRETDGRVALRFESLTPLLQYVDVQSAFRFLHTLTTKLAANGVDAHFQLDPAAVNDRTMSVLVSVCDAQVSLDEGEVSIDQR